MHPTRIRRLGAKALSGKGRAAEVSNREQELFGDASHSGQGSLYYAPTDAASASCYGEIGQESQWSVQSHPMEVDELCELLMLQE